MTGSAGIVLDVVVDSDDEVDDAAWVSPGAVVAAGSVEIVATSATVVAEVESPPLLHADSVSAAIMNVVVVLVYFTGLSAVQKRSSSGKGLVHV
jgi:hypothetical protein